MRLKKYTDYSLRVLLYVGSKEQDHLSSIKEISQAFDISQNHLSKVVFHLGKLELIQTIRGRSGGIKLLERPENINLGDVIRKMESDFVLIDYVQSGSKEEDLKPSGQLKYALEEALQSFFYVLNQYTLKDLLHENEEVNKILHYEA
ncbi:Rrf2 family transcriptional regulator [Pontibacillus chungwhensis BH030062]|uniref:HTH-type transcriptional regulator NsrR n=1 Tax=Pontibacillus chungwhensis BH030062 TaxID=1385513 RepID=A0A0A2V1L8_9BACI|nr:Rrf2 family transcriptional regulator [Pontibacillus chungwhensis]KGP92711.1 Rrf2 family transcriptional regulator [Pontibacillus chungwhensis BH030062]